MTEAAGQNRRRPRGFVRATLLLVLIFAVFGGWTFFWNFASARLDNEIQAQLQRLARDGVEIECAGRDIRGFPFRIGVFCDSVSAEDHAGRIKVSAGALRSAGQAYQPGRVIVELEGPAEIEVARRPRISLAWESARASLRGPIAGLERGSVELTKADLLAFGVRPVARVQDLQVHARRGAAPDSIELAGSAVALQLLQPAAGGPFDIELQAVLQPAPVRLEELLFRPGALKQLRREGLRGTFRHLRFAIGSSSLLISGPFELSPTGEFSGVLKLTAERPAGLLTALAGLLPDEDGLRDLAEQLAGTLALAGDRTEATLHVERGMARLGIVPLGKLPKLF